MKKLIYIEENFITPEECQQLIDYTNDALGGVVTAVGHDSDYIPPDSSMANPQEASAGGLGFIFLRIW